MVSTMVKMISEGTIKKDVGSLFGTTPKAIWEPWLDGVTIDRKNRIILGLNCLIIQVAGKTILVNTGVGSKVKSRSKQSLELMPTTKSNGLKSVGLSEKDIDAVILSHLHSDHCGGCTKLDRTGNLIPAFSKARYYVQRASYEEACSPSERGKYAYHTDNFYPIEARGQLELLDGDTEIFPGLSVIVSDGPAKGHQIVMINHGGERIMFLGDLVPTRYHLDLPVISAFDYSPEGTLAQKREMLGYAKKRGCLLTFYHGLPIKAGYLEQRGELTTLRPVEYLA